MKLGCKSSISFFIKVSDTDDSQDSKERDVIIFIPPYTPTHDHSDIYGQLSIWDDYLLFLIIAVHLVTTFSFYLLIYNKFPHTKAALQRYSYKRFFWKYAANLQENTYAEEHFCRAASTQTSAGFEIAIASTIILLLQRKRLTNWTNHPCATHIHVWR